MPCKKAQGGGSPFGASGAGPYATEEECLNACKEGACCDISDPQDPFCYIVPQCVCLQDGNTFLGVGTACVDGQCVGACPQTGLYVCCSGGQCFVLSSPEECANGTIIPGACDCCPTDPETGTGANVCGEEGWLFVTYDGNCRNGVCENVGYMFCTPGTEQGCEDNIAWCLQNPDQCDTIFGENAWCILLGEGNPLP